MQHHIHSTLTAPQNYAVYAENADGTCQKVRDIHINGGHGLTNIHGILLQGAVTEVDDDTLDLLEKDPTFNVHKRNGFIRVAKSNNIDKVISDMAQRDGSAPGTAQDVAAMYEDGKIPVAVEEYTPSKESKRRRSAEE